MYRIKSVLNRSPEYRNTGIGGGDPFLKPLALALVWGLFFSTVLILVVLPCIYALMDDFAEHVLHRHLVKQTNA